MGDFSAHFQRPDAGIHTVEGIVAGNRAAQLAKQRELAQVAFQEQKHSIEVQQKSERTVLGDKFAGGTTSQKETAFSKQTVGLVTADEFKKLQQQIMVGNSSSSHDDDVTTGTGDDLLLYGEAAAKPKKKELTEQEKKALKKALKKKRKQQQKAKATLSFAAEEEDLFQDDDDDQDQDQKEVPVVKKSKKDPTVDTSFLPDQQRDQQAAAERQRLLTKWKQQQAATKQESLEITYSYWDGSGHRRTVVVQKGDTIGTFLEKARQDLCREFRELTSTAATDALLYIKEDLIIPQDLTFYDLIITKARGKSGPLFHFDVHDDVRVGPMDVRVEKDESHPGKVVERRWYERNKHIFPASRWEIYDPSKDYGKYTIGGGEVNKKQK